jgi:hypothetical protein
MPCLNVLREILNKHVTRAVLLACFDLCIFLSALEMGNADKKKATVRVCAGQATIQNNTNQARLQDNFQQQKSLVQETIKAAGHLCIFLPKFHCELNYIEFFWGVVKKNLYDNCNYTFYTLKRNLPHALCSALGTWHVSMDGCLSH